jgi:uncharacterized membrane protein
MGFRNRWLQTAGILPARDTAGKWHAPNTYFHPPGPSSTGTFTRFGYSISALHGRAARRIHAVTVDVVTTGIPPVHSTQPEVFVMMTRTKMSGLILASAAAALFTTAPMAYGDSHEAKAGEVKCSGVNACKGTGECATATNSCKGQNACKGSGWMHSSKADCDAKGGKVVE